MELTGGAQAGIAGDPEVMKEIEALAPLYAPKAPPKEKKVDPSGMRGPRGSRGVVKPPKRDTPHAKYSNVVYNGKLDANGTPQLVPAQGYKWKDPKAPGVAVVKAAKSLKALFEKTPPPSDELREFFESGVKQAEFDRLGAEDTNALMSLYEIALETQSSEDEQLFNRFSKALVDEGKVEDENRLMDMVEAEHERRQLEPVKELTEEEEKDLFGEEPKEIEEIKIPPKPVYVAPPTRITGRAPFIPELNPDLAGLSIQEIATKAPWQVAEALRRTAPDHVKFHPRMKAMYDKIQANPVFLMDPDLAKMSQLLLAASTRESKWLDDQIKLMQSISDLQADLNQMDEPAARKYMIEARKDYPDATLTLVKSGRGYTVTMSVTGRKSLLPVVALDSEGLAMPMGLWSRGGEAFYSMIPEVNKKGETTYTPVKVGSNAKTALSYEGTATERALESLGNRIVGYDEKGAGISLKQYWTFFDKVETKVTVKIDDKPHWQVSGAFRDKDGNLQREGEEWSFRKDQITPAIRKMLDAYDRMWIRQQEIPLSFEGFDPRSDEEESDDQITGDDDVVPD